MACEFIAAERKRKALEAARKALLMNGATVKRNPLTGTLQIEGMTAADRGGMNDTCILAGLAKQSATDTALNAFFTRAGLKPGQLVKSHQHAHKHNHAH